ncbi:MAG: hypothetical protein VR69_16660 [Peptococcaceae bacterium BRH_c4b]|nr:MAG: hypothetical protein VR69_16660 [Peptococcaceae bacterium BRH_c4b]
MVALVVGLMLAVQFRTNRFIEQGVPSDRAQELTTELRQSDKDIEKLENEVNDLDYKLAQARKGQGQAADAIKSELEKARFYAGFVAVKGPGVEVVLITPPGNEGVDSLSSIQDVDILRLVNELRAAGAEAMSVNGQRIIATSEIRLAGKFINVNLTRLSPPYRVLALGDQERLQSALEIPDGLVETLRSLGIIIEIKPRESLVIPAYTGRPNINYARTL